MAKTMTAKGIEIRMVLTLKGIASRGSMPLTNIWCAHTTKLRTAAAMVEETIQRYPKSGLRQKTGSTSAASPKAGKRTT